MQNMTVTIELEHGLHVRPSAKFVEKAKQFKSAIELEFNDQKVDAKSIFCLQKLELVQGTTVILWANGSDEKDALACLSQFLKSSQTDVENS